MDDWNEIKRSLLTPECLRQPDGDKVLCLSHWKTINSAPILVYPGHLGIWDLLPVWTLQKKEQEKGVYSREGRKNHSPFPCSPRHFQPLQVAVKKSLGCQRIGHTPPYWSLVSPQGVFSAGDFLPPGLWTPWEQKPIFRISLLRTRGAVNICWLRSVCSELDKRPWLTRGCIRCPVSELPPGPALLHPISNHAHGRSLSPATSPGAQPDSLCLRQAQSQC